MMNMIAPVTTASIVALLLWTAGCEEIEPPEPGEQIAAQAGEATEREATGKSGETLTEKPPELPGPAVPPAEEAQPPEWQPPRFEERRDERLRMVRDQVASRPEPYSPSVQDERVLEAMRQVPRHLFVPSHLEDRAYWDQPLPIGSGQTISQPYIVAIMTEQLELEHGERVLEIGTGSGYQAAVLCELTPHVYTVEILQNLGQEARERLQRLGYDIVHVKVADGYYGWEEQGPFDGIIVTCAAGHVPPPLLKQLKIGGRMVVPVGGPYEVQRLMILSKSEDGQIHSRELMPVRFVPMTGRAQQMP